ncbi:hypothetical protein [Methylobacterium dankookense]|uniref:Uncharacterized protein n=1 Tax=Methylobacterium dankookense TaxID=560405 RepID=A0A564G0G1_9HYPH|nr:hypothetical protein [Methylobacterium dankookense]GJD56174.1 hypothetical protein IFDJLNFL_2069 [Methylobacterium dankookense]VUF13963.1 hypothetical protein MTDSW087_03673 [Methylobacterium dankookense]
MREPGRGTERGADGQGWSLSATPMADGVRLELALPDLNGAPASAVLVLERGEARAFARALLAAAGDATERTFRTPPDEG